MADINFPNTPALNDTYTYQGRTWQYNGVGWIVKQSTLGYSDIVNALGYVPLPVTGGTINGNIYTTGNVVASLNVSATYFVGNGAYLTGITSSSSDISLPFNQANTAFDKANAANVLAYNTGIGANAYTNVYANGTANSANAYAASYTNVYANGVANSSNAYAVTIGAASNTYANNSFYTIANGSSAFGFANGVNANVFTTASYANTNHATYAYANTMANNANAYAVTVGAAANTWANTKVDTITSNSTSRIWANSVTVSGVETVYLDLSTSGVTATTYGSSDTIVPYFTVDSYGRITAAGNVTVANAKTMLSNTSGVSFVGDLYFPSGNVGVGIGSTISTTKLQSNGAVYISGSYSTVPLVNVYAQNTTTSYVTSLMINPDYTGYNTIPGGSGFPQHIHGSIITPNLFSTNTSAGGLVYKGLMVAPRYTSNTGIPITMIGVEADAVINHPSANVGYLAGFGADNPAYLIAISARAGHGGQVNQSNVYSVTTGVSSITQIPTGNASSVTGISVLQYAGGNDVSAGSVNARGNTNIGAMYGIYTSASVTSIQPGLYRANVTFYYDAYFAGASETYGSNVGTKYGVYQAATNHLNYFAGNVGINTTTPAYALDIAGTVNASSILVNGLSVVGNVVSNSTSRIWANAVTVSGVETVYLDLANSGVTATTYGSSDTVVPYFTVDSYGRITTAGNVTVANAKTMLSNTSGVSFAGDLYFPSGNVGINTTAPTYPLDINGSANTSAYYYSGDRIAERVLLSTITVASNASVTHTGWTSKYSYYDIIIENLVPATSGINMLLQVYSGTVYSAASYNVAACAAYSQSGLIGGSFNAQTAVLLTGTSGGLGGNLIPTMTNTNGGMSGKVTFFNPVAKINNRHIIGDTTFHSTSGSPSGLLARVSLAAAWANNSSVTGFQILASSGNLSTGKIKVYGYN